MTLEAIRAANKLRMLARLEALRTGAKVDQTPLLRVPAKTVRHAPGPNRRRVPTGSEAHCFHLRDRLNPA
ncbi:MULTISPECIES: hypothetical protein [Methylobacteriaceae]|uniref:hypothetical protein n=1 Tax=Methylobacteriaceae TaxID=119045 RepID=UPI000CDA7E80|nr:MULTISPECIES: hypothetical protein [Methylobacteriaceae]MCP1549458.1 hypothetical protein [Methylorubrum zatmanii]MCP1553929.1 hypothetical protein [Methylorubrum extorquens]MCP1579760.1 hypothetical protein [Methylorubrum extorquens]POR40987.1 hypothetical protein CRT23_21075 [Methylobacterium sp. V23]